MELDRLNVDFAVSGLPKKLKDVMQIDYWKNKIFVAGGYIRSIITNTDISDIDIFVPDFEHAKTLLSILSTNNGIIETENAYTIKSKPVMQIIHRWAFNNIHDIINSFDFTICCAGIYYDGKKWCSECNDRYYIDLASKRLIYMQPSINEDAGGSLLRVLKYYNKGFRITLASYGAIIARAIVNNPKIINDLNNETKLATTITDILKEVYPRIDERTDIIMTKSI